MKRLVRLAAGAVVVLACPAAAHAESVGVSGGVLTSTSAAGTVDTITLSDLSNGTVISDTTSPGGASLGPRCSGLTPTSAYCTGASSVSIQTLDLADSIVNRSSLPATLDGGSGDDTVTGGGAAETVRGGDGNDMLSGGDGSDAVDAGTGDDQVDVRDGAVDTVACGAGSDTVFADAADVLNGCEVVNPVAAAPADAMTTQPGAGTSTTPGGASTGDAIDAPGLLSPVTVAGPVTAQVAPGAAVTVRRNKAPFALTCSAEERSACTGVVFIDPVPTRSEGSRGRTSSVIATMARRGRYGASPFRIRPGSGDSVDVRLTGVALRRLGRPRARRASAARRGRRVKAVVTIAPKRARAQRVTIVLKG